MPNLSDLLQYILYLLLTIVNITLFIFTFNLLTYLIAAGRRGKRCIMQKIKTLDHYPRITIQLPLYNEKYVAVRIIEAAVRVDYPKEKLEIQVLDDSTDETLKITRKAVKKYRNKGVNISLLHRKNRSGYKGGALKAGLKKAFQGRPLRRILRNDRSQSLLFPSTGR